MLTARAEEHDRVQGFGDGVDDYLVKPFAAAELLGRIRAVLRRTTGAPASAAGPTRLGALTLDTREREAYWDGAALGLTATEFAVLDLLARAGGRVVSRDELTAVLHQREATPFERALDVHVSHLRRKIEAAAPDVAHAGSLIRAVRGVGYICSLER
jgi:two-component system response regulator CpxR